MATVVKEVDCPKCSEPIEVEVEESSDEQDVECPECCQEYIAVYDPSTGILQLDYATDEADNEDEEEDDEEEEGFVDPSDEEEDDEERAG